MTSKTFRSFNFGANLLDLTQYYYFLEGCKRIYKYSRSSDDLGDAVTLVNWNQSAKNEVSNRKKTRTSPSPYPSRTVFRNSFIILTSLPIRQLPLEIFKNSPARKIGKPIFPSPPPTPKTSRFLQQQGRRRCTMYFENINQFSAPTYFLQFDLLFFFSLSATLILTIVRRWERLAWPIRKIGFKFLILR